METRPVHPDLLREIKALRSAMGRLLGGYSHQEISAAFLALSADADIFEKTPRDFMENAQAIAEYAEMGALAEPGRDVQ